MYAQQWDMDQIDVPQAHQVTTGSANVVVGVLDSGISSSHPDLATQIDKSSSVSCLNGVRDTAEAAWNPTTSDHGTHVAGTIAAAINGVGVTGVAPGVKVAAVKVVDDEGMIYPEAAVCAFLWAAETGIQITNNSYYIDPWQFNCRNNPEQRAVWQAVQRAIRYSANGGVLHFASAGNSNVDLQHKTQNEQRRRGSPTPGAAGRSPRRGHRGGHRPDAAEELLLVVRPGSRRGDGAGWRHPLPYRGCALDLHRRHPVDHLQHQHPHQRLGLQAGHLDVSPHAAGVAALALSAHPGLQPGALKSFMQRTAEPLACPAGVYNPVPLLSGYEANCYGGKVNGFYGHGEVNAYNAVK